MKKAVLFLSLVMLVPLLGGCNHFGNKKGSGTMKVEKRDVPAFTAVSISGAYEVEIVVQKEQSLEIEGDDNLLPLIRTEVKNGVLNIDNEKSFNTEHALRVRISVPNLDALSTSGANEFEVTNVKSDDFNIEASGAGHIQISGETKELEVGMSGVVGLDAKDLKAQKVNVKTSGAANADVYASEELRASVSGAGNIDYYGDPKTVSEDASGAGSISKK
jgi:Putative auto-transporter adhesin, head GIN domain